MSTTDMLKKSILAGAIIALAVVMYAILAKIDTICKIIGAGIFAFALTYIKEQGLPLFTGKAGTDFPKKSLFAVVLPANFLGTFAICFTAGFCGYNQYFQPIQQSAAADTVPNMLFKAILCGALMRIACSSKSGYVTMGCVFAFLISGFYHSIALSASIFGAIPHAENYDVGGTLTLLIIAILGNWIGAILVTYFGGVAPKPPQGLCP